MEKKTSAANTFFKRLFLGIWNIIGILLILGVVTAVSLIGINIYVISSTVDSLVSAHDMENQHADYILVLGAGLDKEGEPSPMLAERLNTGADLYALNAADKILLSGDSDKQYYDEVKAMKAYLKKKGLKNDDIASDPDGKSTYDSVVRAKEKFDAEEIIIVSQKYHLYRALQIADSLGIKAYGVACDPHPWSGQSEYGNREFWARIKDFIQVETKDWPKPLKNIVAKAVDQGSELVPVS